MYSLAIEDSYWKWQFSMSKSTISMAIFNNYAKLPESRHVGLSTYCIFEQRTWRACWSASLTGRLNPMNDAFHVGNYPNDGCTIEFGRILDTWRIQIDGRSAEPSKIRFRRSRKRLKNIQLQIWRPWQRPHWG